MEGGVCVCSACAVRVELLGKRYISRVCAAHLALVPHGALHQVKLASEGGTSH